MEFTAKQIAQYVNGTVEGDENAVVSTFCKIEEGTTGALTFLSNPKYLHFIYSTKASVVLVNNDMQLEEPTSATLIRVQNAYEGVAKLLQLYASMSPQKSGIDSLAFVAPTAQLGADCYVGAFAYIGENAKIGNNCKIYPGAYVGDNVTLGNDVTLYPRVVVYHDCHLGNRIILHAGVVIGADGFGFAPTPQGYEKIPQIGIVTIEDDVEIGANTCVDRSTMGSTYVRRGVKLDNLVQVAHNVEVGQHTVMSAQTGIAGSAKIGQWCMLGGQVGVAGHIRVADQTHVGAQAGIIGTIKQPGQTIIGSPAWNAKGFMKSAALFRHLDDMQKELQQLRKEVEQLKK